MCEPEGDAFPVGGLVKVAGIVAAAAMAVAVVWWVLELTAPYLVAMEVALVVSVVVARKALLRLSPVLQRTGRPALCSGYLAHRLAAQYARPRRVRQAALSAGTRLMLEAAKPPVHAVITDVRERTGHVR